MVHMRPDLMGSKHHNAKLTEEKVWDARIWYWDEPDPITIQGLAEHFHVAFSTMAHAVYGRTWRHVPQAEGAKARDLARNITLESSSGYRAVMVFEFSDGTRETCYEGIYDKPGTANQRISFWTNAGVRNFWDGPEWDKKNIRRGALVDSWREKATITWAKEDD